MMLAISCIEVLVVVASQPVSGLPKAVLDCNTQFHLMVMYIESTCTMYELFEVQKSKARRKTIGENQPTKSDTNLSHPLLLSLFLLSSRSSTPDGYSHIYTQ